MKLAKVFEEAQKLPHLVIPDYVAHRALKELGKGFQNGDRLLKYLTALDNHLYRLKFETAPGFDLARRFKELSGIDYHLGEGKQTNRCSHMVKLRRFEWRGHQYSMDHHTGHGGHDGDGKTFREYHDFDLENRLIVIGHIGGHLENHSAQFDR